MISFENQPAQYGKEERAGGPRWRLFVFLFIASIIIIALRRPDAILNPQFWAEDGTVFYADAYHRGIIIPLLSPYGGYLDTFPRLVAAFSQFFPLSWAPLLFNFSAIIIQVLPVALIMSSRFSSLIPDWRVRIFLSFLYLNLPNSWEIHANLTNAKVHLSLLAFIVLSAGPGSHPLWRIFDTGIILISGLSGPFCIMLTPIAALFWFFRRDKRSFILLMLIGICALIQGAFLLMDHTRPQMPLGATPKLFLEILTGQVFLGALAGQKGLQFIAQRVLPLIGHFATLYNLIVIVFGIAGLAALINIMRKTPLELRLFILYALLSFCAALLSPLVNLTDPQWPLLLLPGVGGRYWFVPMLAFISVLVWSLRRSSSRISKAFAALAFAVMIIGIILDWRHPAFKDFNFEEHAYRFESAPIGTQTTIPINPSGWSITLLRH